MANQKVAVAEQNKQAVVLPDAERMVDRFINWYRGKYMHGPERNDLLMYHDFLQEKINEDMDG